MARLTAAIVLPFFRLSLDGRKGRTLQAVEKPFQPVIPSAARNLALSLFNALAHARRLTETQKP